MNNCLMDVWCELEPKVCRVNPKGYRLKIEDYMPVLVAETATGMSAILGVALYLTRKKEMYNELDDFTTDDVGDLEYETTGAVRRYLAAVKGEPEEYDKLPLFETDGL
jgi:hypothetical protein